jgi:hypothetical protein
LIDMCIYISGVSWSNRASFMAAMSRNTSLRSGQRYMFGSVFLDSGNMYNPKTGIVRIPYSGNYVITWYVVTDGRSAAYPYLYRNGRYTSFASCARRKSCGNTITLGLEKGDRLWIEESSYNSHQTNVRAWFSTFAAWKL